MVVAKGKAKRADEAEARQAGRKVARLERRLGRLTAKEGRLSRRLSKAQERVRAVEERLRELRGSGPAGGPAATTTTSVPGYCLRERRRVTLSDAQPVTLRNGRTALAGTCPDCGARIVSMAAVRVAAT